jgi:hypothetical protein
MASASELARQKAKALRYKRAIVHDLNLETIQSTLWDMQDTCSNVRYYCGDEGETLLYNLIGDDDEAFEFKMMFSDLDSDIERMSEDLENTWIPECFDDFFSSIGAGAYCGGMIGYDRIERDYFEIDGFEQNLAAKESAKRLKRLTKDQLLEAAQVCFRIAVNFISLKTRYDNLKASFDVLQGQGAGYLQVVRQIDQAYEAAADRDFRPFDQATRDFDRLVEAIPDEAWVQ